MKRKPIYHKENAQFRVISSHNGLWVAQERSEAVGSNEWDAWKSLHRPTTQDAAIAYMHMKCPLKQAA